LSLAGLPFSQDYPLTQLEEGFAIDAGPSLVRRRMTVAQRQFSLFHDAETKDVFIQLHTAVEPLFVGFENPARFQGPVYVDLALENVSSSGASGKCGGGWGRKWRLEGGLQTQTKIRWHTWLSVLNR
jgi:hypothetical protein